MSNPTVPIGPELRKKREELAISLRELSTRTKISIASLTAIEEDRADRNLPDVFCRAHLRQMLEALGEDPALWSDRIAVYLAGRRKRGDPGLSPWAVKRTRAMFGMASIVIVGLVLAWGLAPRAGNWRGAVRATADHPAAAGNDAPRTGTVSPGAPVPAAPSASPVSVELLSRGFTSVKYQIDGHETQQLFLREGERKELSGGKRITLILFKPRSIDVYYEGRKVEEMEWLGQVARMTFPPK